MTVRIYKSTDGSAPSLTGVAGSLVALLDACLVNGYGAKTAAGWTIAYTAANKRAYQQNTTGSNNTAGMLLWVDDSAPTTAKEARCCGFETMSAITPTGTGQFPVAGQPGIAVSASGYLAIRKSATADATARAWTLIANGQSFYLITETGDATAPINCPCFFFGDFKSYKTGDQYAVAIIGRFGENNSTATGAEPMAALSDAGTTGNPLSFSLPGHFVARRHTGVGGSVRFGKATDRSKATMGTGGSYAGEASTTLGFTNVCMGRYNVNWPFQVPNPVDGALWLSPVYVCHEGALRGYLPGLWCPLHDRPLAHNDTLTVAGGNLNGKSMIAQSLQCAITGNNDAAMGFFEYSDTWS